MRASQMLENNVASERAYLNLLNELTQAPFRTDRTGTGVYSLFGKSLQFDISHFFPLLTTKKMNFSAIVHELLWFISGTTNIQYLKDNKVNIWNEWASPSGEVGPMYGYQWRHFGGDQLERVIQHIKFDSHSRRLVVSSWNAEDIHRMALPPCHVMFQFYVNGRYLDMSVYQRSADVFLGLPFNIASYALLNYMVAYLADITPGTLHYFLGDVHLYSNHYEQARTQLRREPYIPPKVGISDRDSIDEYVYDDVLLLDYKHHPAIPAEVAV